MARNKKNDPRRFRPSFEQLEDRQLMSASAVSNLGNVPTQFNLNANGHLLMTQGSVPTDLGTGVQALFQGHDSAGHQVAYELLANHALNEFTPEKGWVSLGTADQVVQDASGLLVFTHDHALSLATGIPGSAVSLFKNIQGLTASGDHFSIQVGSLLKADVAVSFEGASGAATLHFTNVQINVGDFLNNVTGQLQKFTAPLENLADKLTSPVLNQSWASTLTPINLLKMLPGHSQDAQNAQNFADTVHAINKLTTSGSGWVKVGDFSARFPGGSAALTLSSAPDLSAVTSALSSLRKIQGLQTALDDSRQLLTLLTGGQGNLFSYTLNLNTNFTFEQRLATILISPATGTELDLDLIGNLKLSGGATFGFDSTGLQSGNLAKGLYIQNANFSATVSVGLAGTINEAYLVGYRLTGQLTGTVTASVLGKVSADQLANGSVKVHTGDSLKVEVVTKALGPKDLLGKYLTPQAAAAAAKALNDGVNAAATAVKNAFNNAVAHNAQALKDVSKKGAAVANALKGVFNQGAEESARVLSGLRSQFLEMKSRFA